MTEPADLIVREEHIAERSSVVRLLCDAFGKIDEAQLTEDLHRDGDVLVGLVAEADGDIVGYVLFSRVVIETLEGPVPAVTLAPLAVAEAYRRRGIGAALVEQGLGRLAAKGEDIVFVIGHPDYYRRFGFSSEDARAFRCPWSKEAGDAHMVLSLTSRRLAGKTGSVTYSRGFERFVPAGEASR
ncbi:GNAT family N-acetyltransferase [Rhodobium gokarnense]|uniref:Acetyltransferase n=1 Tax=Rhodobium gokarnense TaxID=364296 RepID=A0ABT3H805_9HYPH|nr:N-acetyltransferase [Rhodobium gokarnense]MCW2306532.1 putative acetyltransferase [Rhodobium gokarnense]